MLQSVVQPGSKWQSCGDMCIPGQVIRPFLEEIYNVIQVRRSLYYYLEGYFIQMCLIMTV
jgi:hypothetical protein